MSIFRRRSAHPSTITSPSWDRISEAVSATPAATELVTASVAADIRPGSPSSWAELWNDSPHDPSEQARFAQFIDLADDDNKAARWLMASGK